jgi:hypothetical protein
MVGRDPLCEEGGTPQGAGGQRWLIGRAQYPFADFLQNSNVWLFAPACLMIISMIARIAVLALAALAAEPTGTLTLACQGTTQWSDEAKPEPTSTGLIIDFTARTLEGFGRDVTFPIRITDVTETTIQFTGNNWSDPNKTASFNIFGTIDRVIGAVEATLTGTMMVGQRTSWSASYLLKCKPTQRMF